MLRIFNPLWTYKHVDASCSYFLQSASGSVTIKQTSNVTPILFDRLLWPSRMSSLHTSWMAPGVWFKRTFSQWRYYMCCSAIIAGYHLPVLEKCRFLLPRGMLKWCFEPCMNPLWIPLEFLSFKDRNLVAIPLDKCARSKDSPGLSTSVVALSGFLDDIGGLDQHGEGLLVSVASLTWYIIS